MQAVAPFVVMILVLSVIFIWPGGMQTGLKASADPPQRSQVQRRFQPLDFSPAVIAHITR